MGYKTRILKYAVLFSVVSFMIICCPKFSFAAASLSISGGNWAIGQTQSLVETSTANNRWTITNDSNGTETIQIKVTTTTGVLTARTTDDNNNAASEYVVRVFTGSQTPSAGMLVTNSDKNLTTGLAPLATYSFGLWFKAPNYGTMDTQPADPDETLTITLTATSWVQNCSGWIYNGFCWYSDPVGNQSCTTICASHGGCMTPLTWNDDASCTVLRHFYTGISSNNTGYSYFAPYKNGSYGYMRYSGYTVNCDTAPGANSYRVCACFL